MNRKTKATDELFIHPPWGQAFGVLLGLVFCVAVLLRFSELGCVQVQLACRTALWLAGIGTAAGLWPVLKGIHKDGWSMVARMVIGGMIRLGIGLGGIAGLLYFTSVHTLWLIAFYLIAYFCFLIMELVIAGWLLSRSRWDEDESAIPENAWNFAGHR